MMELVDMRGSNPRAGKRRQGSSPCVPIAGRVLVSPPWLITTATRVQFPLLLLSLAASVRFRPRGSFLAGSVIGQHSGQA
jgi:hypothetical protein